MTAMAAYRGAGLRLLWWATLAELVLVRLVSRVGIFIPKSGVALTVYRAVIAAGEVAFSFSLFLGVLLLVMALAGHRWWGRALGGAAGLLVMAAPGAAPPAGWSLAVMLVAAAFVAVLGLWALRQVATSPWERLTLALVLGAHLVDYLVGALQLGWVAFALPGGVTAAGAALRAGELLALAAPVCLLPFVRRWGSVKYGAMGLGAASVLGLTYFLNADITAILAMYSLGFTLSWPVWLYLLALGLGVPGLLAFTRAAPERGLALGLLFLAGYTLGNNQQHLLVLAGWALLALPAAATSPEEVTLA